MPQPPKPDPMASDRVSVDLDAIRRAVMARPQKVLDAVRIVCDVNEDLIFRLVNGTSGTQEAVMETERLRGRILGLQDVLQTFVSTIIEENDDGE